MIMIQPNEGSGHPLRIAVVVVVSFAAISPCLAGHNAYGTLILHQNPALQGSCDGAINGLSGIERCADAVTSVDDPTQCAVVYVLANFPSWQFPRLRSVSFGFDYDPALLSLSNLSATGDLEVPTSGWPAPGSGTSVAWNEPRRDRLIEVYALSAETDDAISTQLRLAPHPTQGATFTGPLGGEDPIHALGVLGWGMEGDLTCAPEAGACCMGEGGCSVMLPPECADEGGTFLGSGAACEPGACPETSGACCVDGECQIRTQLECVQMSGRFIGPGQPCQTYTCTPETGACCFPDGRCGMLPEEVCLGQGGVFVGYDVDCAVTRCATLFGCGPATPNLPPRDHSENAAGELGRSTEGDRVDDSSGDPPCGELLLHTDGTFENGYIWQYGGIVPPYFGAFAECFEGNYLVCNAVIELTQIGFGESAYTDLYLWDDDGGCPGAVQCVRPRVLPSGIAFWPSVSQHRFAMPQCCMSGRWWIGYWPDWQGGGGAFYVGADLDGPTPGCPKTCIAPGLGYPSGWQNVSVVWGPTVAIGIGAEVLPCGPVPVERTSLGKIKALYGPKR